MLESLTCETFESLLDEQFVIAFPDVQSQARLASVKRLAPPSEEYEGRTPWSLVFATEDEGHYDQGMYRVSNSSVGDLELFLVPIGPGKSGMQYEAVFT